jgi:ferredoxin
MSDIPTAGLNVEVDGDVCMSSGSCQRTLPAIFSSDADGVVELVGADGARTRGPIQVATDAEEGVRRAARLCPAAAIIVGGAD